MIAAALDRMSSAVERADLDHHLEGLAEEIIADQHARLVAPDHARRQLAAPQLALVDHVVVEKRGGVHELDAGGELDMAVARVAAHPRRGDGQHRPQPLAAGGDQVPGDVGDDAHIRAGAVDDQRVDPLHVVPGQPHQRLDAGTGAPLALVER